MDPRLAATNRPIYKLSKFKVIFYSRVYFFGLILSHKYYAFRWKSQENFSFLHEKTLNIIKSWDFFMAVWPNWQFLASSAKILSRILKKCITYKKFYLFLFCACVLQFKIYRAAIAKLLEFIAKEKINNKIYNYFQCNQIPINIMKQYYHLRFQFFVIKETWTTSFCLQFIFYVLKFLWKKQ
jgi:hypothetical protein